MSHEAHVLYQNNFNGKNYDYKAFMKTHRKGFTIDNEAGLKMIDRNYGMKYYVHEGEGGLLFLYYTFFFENTNLEGHHNKLKM